MSFLLTAPEMKIRINGTLAGYVTGFSYQSSQGQKMVFGVDSPFPQEIAQGAAPSFVEGSFQVVRPKGGSPETWGYMTPRTSSDGISESGDPSSTALGSGRYSTIEIFDRKTDALMFKALYVMFGTQNWRVVVKDVMLGTISFQGITVVHTANSETTGSFF